MKPRLRLWLVRALWFTFGIQCLILLLAVASATMPARSLYMVEARSSLLSFDVGASPQRSAIAFEGVRVRVDNRWLMEGDRQACLTGTYWPEPGVRVELRAKGAAQEMTLSKPGGVGELVFAGGPAELENGGPGSEADIADPGTQAFYMEGDAAIVADGSCDRSGRTGFALPGAPILVDGAVRIGTKRQEVGPDGRQTIGGDAEYVDGTIGILFHSAFCALQKRFPILGDGACAQLHASGGELVRIPSGAAVTASIGPADSVAEADMIGHILYDPGTLHYVIRATTYADSLLITPAIPGAELDRSYRVEASLLDIVIADNRLMALFSSTLAVIGFLVTVVQMAEGKPAAASAITQRPAPGPEAVEQPEPPPATDSSGTGKVTGRPATDP